MVVGSLLIGMAGYEYFEGLAWRDAFLNAAMLLGGMGPWMRGYLCRCRTLGCLRVLAELLGAIPPPPAQVPLDDRGDRHPMTRVLLITGASRGIGAAAARLAIAGDVGGTEPRAADEVVAAITGAARAVALAGDVAVDDDVVRMFAACEQALGPITDLVNNAGVVDMKARVDEMSAARLQRMFAVNVFGTMLCAREAVKRMSSRHGGAGGVIVNVSSVAARIGSPGEYVDYAAAKGAVDVFTIGLAKEVATEGIRVNAVRPGIVRTEIHASGGQPDRLERIAPLVPMLRPGEPDEIAGAILWLLSPEASYTSGALLDVSGGR